MRKRLLKKNRCFSLSKLPGMVSSEARNKTRRRKSGDERDEGSEYWIEMKTR